MFDSEAQTTCLNRTKCFSLCCCSAQNELNEQEQYEQTQLSDIELSCHVYGFYLPR